MESRKNTTVGGLQGTFSRRNLIKGAAALTAAANMPEAFGQQPTGAPSGTVWLYIGTYTGSPGSGGNGNGIYLCSLDLRNGNVSVVRPVAPAPPPGTTGPQSSPSTIALDPTRTHLYSGNEIGPPGAVNAYSINRQTGDLTHINGQPTLGAPAHVSVDQTGSYLFAAEYSGGWFEVFPIGANGALGPAVFQKQDTDNINIPGFGKTLPATNAPLGSFAFSAHEGPNGHPHQMETDPSNGWVLGSDAGQDRIYVWKLNLTPPLGNPPLTPAATPFATVERGDGPRHFAFHPNGIWMYSIQEEASTIIFWHFDPATGSLTQQQMVSSLPPGFAGTDFTSEIRVSADGRQVYGTNRLNDTITVFSVGHDGTLSFQSYASTLGDYPRIITIDPTGRFIVSANQRSDNLTTFGVNPGNGKLDFTGTYTAIGSPSGMVFLY